MNSILCAGCSHTAEFYWDPWPAYIANSTNVGIRGAGTDLVSKRVIVELQKNVSTLSLKGFNIPKKVYFTANQLPRNKAGKIDKRLLQKVIETVNFI